MIRKLLSQVKRHRFKIVFAVIFSLSVPIAGIIYQWRGSERDARDYPPPGQMIDVNGTRLHIDCRGEGSPTVIMEAGMGDTSLVWNKVQPKIAEFTRVCTYDRAGLGWSDLPSDWTIFRRRRTSQQMVEELHALLVKAKMSGPYIMVGHSLGGMNVRLYASQYPQDVVGMVLIDSSHEHMYQRLPKAALDAQHKKKRELFLASLSAPFGLIRLSTSDMDNPCVPPEMKMANMAVQLRTFATWIKYSEYKSFEESAAQVSSAPSMPRDIPLLVLTATADKFPELSAEERQHTREVWNELQQDLVSRSRKGRQIIIEKSSHTIQCEQPQEVIGAVREVVEEVRHVPE